MLILPTSNKNIFMFFLDASDYMNNNSTIQNTENTNSKSEDNDNNRL